MKIWRVKTRAQRLKQSTKPTPWTLCFWSNHLKTKMVWDTTITPDTINIALGKCTGLEKHLNIFNSLETSRGNHRITPKSFQRFRARRPNWSPIKTRWKEARIQARSSCNLWFLGSKLIGLSVWISKKHSVNKRPVKRRQKPMPLAWRMNRLFTKRTPIKPGTRSD